MIAVDTSAVVAILKREPDALTFAQAIGDAPASFMSAVAYFEASMVMISGGPAELAIDLDRLIRDTRVEIVAFDTPLALASREAFVRFGKGRHPAGLNFGDCISYALAKTRGLPLLYKGADFAKTDIASALAVSA